MLFMGEEYGEKNGFPFFCDFQDESLKEAVRNGRKNEFREFRWQDAIPDPLAQTTFESAKLTRDGMLNLEQQQLKLLYRWLIDFRQRKNNLTDRTLLRTKLHSFESGAHILELSRFHDLEHQELDWFACFNLSESVWDIQHSLFPNSDSTANIFRSETIEFEPDDFDADCLEVLAPHQFFIVESKRESNFITVKIQENASPNHSDRLIVGERT